MIKKFDKRVNLYITTDLYKFLLQRAEKSQRSFSNYVRALLEQNRQIIEAEEKTNK